MTVEKVTEKNIDTQQGLLVEHQRQRDQLAQQLELMNGQVAMQELFVDTRSLVAQTPEKAFRGIEGVYNGQPAVLEVVDCMTDNKSDSRGYNIRDNARYIISSKVEDGDGLVLCDMGITRTRTRESWDAMVGDYHAKVSRKAVILELIGGLLQIWLKVRINSRLV
jgi:hypothetical protein